MHYDDTYQVTGADDAASVKGNSVSVPALTEKCTYDAVGMQAGLGAAVRFPHTGKQGQDFTECGHNRQLQWQPRS